MKPRCECCITCLQQRFQASKHPHGMTFRIPAGSKTSEMADEHGPSRAAHVRRNDGENRLAKSLGESRLIPS